MPIVYFADAFRGDGEKGVFPGFLGLRMANIRFPCYGYGKRRNDTCFMEALQTQLPVWPFQSSRDSNIKQEESDE
ncbi:MAG: hypothetical protein D6820_11235 [Lentisphaerae bacterium]|nr:MAG: hypothetical protein D6820_11235 [Lentisphaerota bacterium]